jgi:hypothetical protein
MVGHTIFCVRGTRETSVIPVFTEVFKEEKEFNKYMMGNSQYKCQLMLQDTVTKQELQETAERLGKNVGAKVKNEAGVLENVIAYQGGRYEVMEMLDNKQKNPKRKRSQIDNTRYDQLSMDTKKLYIEQGYLLKDNMVSKDNIKELVRITKARGKNNWVRIPGNKRFQTMIGRKERQEFINLLPNLVSFLHGLGYQDKKIATAKRGGLSVLRSDGSSERQLLHSDYDENAMFRNYTDKGHFSGIPLVVIVPLCDNTPFLVMPGAFARGDVDPVTGRCKLENPANTIRVEMKRGQIMLFRADLLHAGAAFQLPEGESNYRMHIFVSSSGTIGDPPNAFKKAEAHREQDIRPRRAAKTKAKSNLDKMDPAYM